MLTVGGGVVLPLVLPLVIGTALPSMTYTTLGHVAALRPIEQTKMMWFHTYRTTTST
jgi:hypothetical protein